MSIRIICGLAALAAAAPAGAQAPAEAGDAGQLDTVNVTSRRSIEQRFFAPGSLVVIDRADIEQLGAFSVADVLKQLPGVVVTTSGDGSIEIRMRGMDRSATQVLVDGQRTSGGRNQLALDQLPPEMIERIEIVRSPSAEFSGATGGTINLVLREASIKRETVIRLTDNTVWGRHAGQGFYSRTGPLGGGAPATPAGAPAASQPWAYFVAVSSSSMLLGSDVHRVVEQAGTTLTSDAAWRYRRNEQSVLPRLSRRIGPSDQLALRGTVLRRDYGGAYRSSGVSAPASTALAASERQDQAYQHLQAAADWTHAFKGSKLETTANASRSTESVARNGVSTPGTGAAPFDAYGLDEDRSDTHLSLRSKLTGTASSLVWSVGGDAERRELSVDSRTGGAAPVAYGAVLDRQVLWGQNEWDVWNGSTLTAGLRGETLRTESRAGGLPATHWRSSFLQPSVHLRKPLDDALQWRANLARTTRNPSVWDLIDRNQPAQGANSLANPDTVGNPGLRPERSLALDIGFERRLEQGAAGINLFVRQVDDAIAPLVSLVGGRWVWQRVNIGDALVWGLESDVKADGRWLGLPHDWQLAANASLLQSRMTSGVNRGERIPGQPRYNASVSVSRPIRRTGGPFAGATLNLTGAADLNTSPNFTGRDAPRANLDLYVGSVVRGLGYWRVGVFNVTDARYRRERQSVDPATGAVTRTTSAMRLTPRVFLTVGTQF